MNVTVPVGVPPVDVTVAVIVIDCPSVEGLGAAVTEVTVDGLFDGNNGKFALV